MSRIYGPIYHLEERCKVLLRRVIHMLTLRIPQTLALSSAMRFGLKLCNLIRDTVFVE